MIPILKFLLVLLYITACGVLIFSVLLQQGKGATLGASLGGGASQTVFGSRTSNFMTRATSVMAGVFMVLALVLAKYPPFGNDTSSDARDILTPEAVGAIDTAPAAAPTTQPAAVTVPGTDPAGAVPASIDVTADVVVPLELVPTEAGEAAPTLPADDASEASSVPAADSAADVPAAP